MNARDIIKLAAQLYVYDALKKKITILTNIQKGKDINILFLPTSKALDSLNPKDAIEANAINFFNESCQALGILVDLNKKRLATCKNAEKRIKNVFRRQ